MRIVQLVPGAGGGFYCENCLRDTGLVRTIRAAGHEMLVVPLYLPPRPELDALGGQSPIFFGGINVHLQQQWGLFRRTPRWLDRLFDSRWLLARIAPRAGMTKAAVLGETTLSMLRGADGKQIKELRRLVDWLAAGDRPDVICLSNALLAGMVPAIKSALDVPVVSILQDEDGYLDALGEPYSEQAWELLAHQASRVDAFIAVSDYYAGQMRRRLNLPPDRVHVVRTGIDGSRYTPAPVPPEPAAIGFLSQMAPSKGLDLLAEAFIRCKTGGGHADLKLKVAGGKTAGDEKHIRQVRRRLKQAGVDGDVEFIEDFDSAAKQAFLESLSVVSVPTRHGEAYGLFVLEALACGVPVVLPRHGAFVELVEATGGGLLCEPNSPEALAAALGEVLDDPDRARELGRTGRDVVLADFTVEQMAAATLRVWERAISGAT